MNSRCLQRLNAQGMRLLLQHNLSGLKSKRC